MKNENPRGAGTLGEIKGGSLSLRQVEIFHAVMQTKSVTGAARLLNISQPSLSRTVRRIEDVLGLPLFHRTAGGLVPTHEALMIFEEVDQIIGRLSGLGTQIARIVRGEGHVFRIGSTASVARALVPQALNELLTQSPGIELFFDVLAVDQIETYLITGEGECVVTIAPMRHPLIECLKLGEVHMVAVVPHTHPLAEREGLRIGDLDGTDLISFQVAGAHHRIVDRWLREAGITVRTRAVVRFSDTAIALADQGMGIALIDSLSALGPIGNGVVIRQVEDSPAVEVFMLLNNKRPRSRHVAVFRDNLKRRIAAHVG